jgi:parallel beta-helix repeat protein
MKTTSGSLSATMTLLLICAATLASAPFAEAAATYYVSSSSGNDANDGRTPGTAWNHLSKIYMKSVSKEAFQPGDNILLKRGDRWDGQIRLQANGAPQKPVTIGAYGDGPKPLIIGELQPVQWKPELHFAGIYKTDMGPGSVLGSIFLNGQQLRTIFPLGTVKGSSDLAIFLTKLQSGTLAGQFQGHLWLRVPDGPPDQQVRIFRLAGVSLSNSSYIQIENLDIERFQTGIDIENSEWVTARHNDIQDVLGIGIYLRLSDSDCRVESNTVFRSGNTALYVLKGSRNTFRDNWVSHVEKQILGLTVSGDKMGVGLQESQKTLVEYNYFTRSGGMDFYYEQGSTVRYNYLYYVTSAGAPHGVDLNVYGNIYNLGKAGGKPSSAGVNAVATGPGTISIFNNTIFNASRFFLMGSSNKGGQIVFSDNIAVATVAGVALTAYGTNVTSNHNCFSTPGEPVFTHSKTSLVSLATYQTNSGLDRNSVFAEPKFVNPEPATPLDFRIAGSSGCNSPASPIPLANSANGRTYDHDREIPNTPVIGALRVDATSSHSQTFSQRCSPNCFHHPLPVPNGVYLVRLKFGTGSRLPAQDFAFLLNGRQMVVDFRSSALMDLDARSRDFLVRPETNSIRLDADKGADTSVVTEVEILPFDTDHGSGLQVISW